MKPETEEWIEKAEGDLKVARREKQTQDPVYDAVCFHAQQGAEKYIKASLEEDNIAFPKSHDLVVLLNLSEGSLSRLEPLREHLAHLSTLGIPLSSLIWIVASGGDGLQLPLDGEKTP